MKLRQGFVSNSSSCSFVVIGIKVPKDKIDEELEETIRDEYNLIDDYEMGYDNPDYSVIGMDLCGNEDEYLEESETTLNEMKDIEKVLHEKFGLIGELVVITGTKMC